MTAHVLKGPTAGEVIAALEVVFERRTRIVVSASQRPRR